MDWIVYQGIGIPINPIFHESPTKSDCRFISKNLNVPLIRWIENWDCSSISSFYAVIQDIHTPISDLNRQVRYEVNRASRFYHFVELTLEELKNEGYELYYASFKRYDTFLQPMSRIEFIDSFSNRHLFNDNDDFRYFGIRENMSGALVCYAYGIKYIRGNYYDLKVVKFNPEHQRYNISELLFYKMGEKLIYEEKVSFIFDGYVSIAHKSGIQQYLMRKFSYRKAYCKLCVYYNPCLKLFINLIYPFRHLVAAIGKFAVIFQKLNILLIQENLKRKQNIPKFNYNGLNNHSLS